MTRSARGIVRSALTAGAGAGLVFAAMHAPGALALGPAANADTSRAGGTATVRSAALVCPGPELKGVAGIADLPVGATVAAAAAPIRALTGLALPAQAGSFSTTSLTGRPVAPAATTRGTVAAVALTAGAAVQVRGGQSLAPGLAATQTSLVTGGDNRALTMTACGQPSADAWLVAGGGAPGRQERLVLTNPGENPITVDLTLHGAKGPVESPNGKGVVVPSRGRATVLLDSISSTETAPAVHVVAHGGLVHAVLNDHWLDGSLAAGSDDAVAAAAPSRDQVIPAVGVGAGSTLRVAVPGDGEAVVQARLLTAAGPRALPRGGVVRVGGGSVRDLSLDGIRGVYGVQVRADVPVVAAAVAHRRSARTAVGDFAWSSSTQAVRGVAGTALPALRLDGKPLAQTLVLTASGAAANVEVVTTDATGTASSRRLTLAADTSRTVNVAGASSVWVHRLSGAGELRAGLVVVGVDRRGQLLSSVPLADTALRTTSVGLLEIPQ